jgi:hypothetical protein
MSDAWFCGGCGETDPSKRCLGCLHGMTAPSSSASEAVVHPVYISAATLQYLLDGMRLGSVFVSLEPTMDSPAALYPSSEIERLRAENERLMKVVESLTWVRRQLSNRIARQRASLRQNWMIVETRRLWNGPVAIEAFRRVKNAHTLRQAAEARAASAEAERDALKAQVALLLENQADYVDLLNGRKVTIDALAARLAVKDAALEPFVRFADVYDAEHIRRGGMKPEQYDLSDAQTVATGGRWEGETRRVIKVGDLRRAREARTRSHEAGDG